MLKGFSKILFIGIAFVCVGAQNCSAWGNGGHTDRMETGNLFERDQMVQAQENPNCWEPACGIEKDEQNSEKTGKLCDFWEKKKKEIAIAICCGTVVAYLWLCPEHAAGVGDKILEAGSELWGNACKAAGEFKKEVNKTELYQRIAMAEKEFQKKVSNTESYRLAKNGFEVCRNFFNKVRNAWNEGGIRADL
ncbi:MAG: hypothetical protein LBF72_02460 [Holosporales bacterium]|jgi:hypothetical protein|nr:hypothetical protein [Holosporales bacterium]